MPKREWYVWRETDDHYQGVRIIFLDTEKSNWAWDPLSKSYYWHRFFSHQPDLNYDNPAVFEAMWDIMNFWLQIGMDEFRLHAVPYLFHPEQPPLYTLPAPHPSSPALRIQPI